MRPRDEHGRTVRPPHQRMADASRYEMAGVQALSADGRLAHLDFKTKLKMARKALDHVVDGDERPAWLWGKEGKSPARQTEGGTCLSQGFEAAVTAIRAAGAAPKMDHGDYAQDGSPPGAGSEP
ncbi:MAG: hypothetical protein ACK4Z5_03315 [Brevundimonas sp.]